MTVRGRVRQLVARHAHALSCAAMVACAPAGSGGGDLGDFEATSKADAVEVEVPFEIGAGEEVELTLRTVGRLHVDTDQTGGEERLQLVAESAVYRRRSWRGRAPFLRIPGSRTGGDLTEYSLRIVSWGDAPTSGVLRITTDALEPAGVTLVANQPDCDGCDDPAGALRRTVVDAIQSANATIDAAVYGLDDPAVVDALCNAREAGVRVRVVSDATDADELGERYHASLMDPVAGLVGCDIPVELIAYGGIMHHKFLAIDAGTDSATLVTGSTNLTEADFDVSHNHAIVVRGAPALVDAYTAELEQLFGHCVSDGCGECTPACTLDVSEEGPFTAGDTSVRVLFSPTDDALRALRGEVRTERLARPDPACDGAADCRCERSGAAWRCDYCAQGEDGWGLLHDAHDHVLATMYAATDTCFALGVARAEKRGAETLVVYDMVNAASPYSVDDLTCALGVPTLVSAWDDGSAQARNHHKLVVVDDVVFTGSMNLSASGDERNHENTLLVEDAALAEQAAALVRSEAALLGAMGVESGCAATH